MNIQNKIKILEETRQILSTAATDICILQSQLPIISDTVDSLVQQVQAIDYEIEKLEIDAEIVADSLNE